MPDHRTSQLHGLLAGATMVLFAGGCSSSITVPSGHGGSGAGTSTTGGVTTTTDATSATTAGAGGGTGGSSGQGGSAAGYVIARPGTDAAAFARGQLVFEKMFTPAEGLGPYYNDTSCKACHSGPDTGGQGDLAHRVYMDELSPKHTPGGDTVYPDDEPYHIPPRLFGIGYLDDISDAQIVAGCGVDDALGIHGTPGQINDGPILRFGRNLRTRNVRAFVSGALSHELGISNNGSPDENATCTDDPHNPIMCGPGVPMDAEMGTVDDLVTFTAGLDTLPSLPFDPEGKALFLQTGCGVCHRIDAPYLQGTDLCLHDMGDLKEPAYPAGPPPYDYVRLWGTTRLSGVRFSTLLLHDGRVSTIDDAIRAHDGEGAIVKQAYVDLADPDRAALIAFVMSL